MHLQHHHNRLANGWLSNEWLVILALAVAISFVITNILYRYAHSFFGQYKEFFYQFEREQCLAEDTFCQPKQAPIVVMLKMHFSGSESICLI